MKLPKGVKIHRSIKTLAALIPGATQEHRNFIMRALGVAEFEREGKKRMAQNKAAKPTDGE